MIRLPSCDTISDLYVRSCQSKGREIIFADDGGRSQDLLVLGREAVELDRVAADLLEAASAPDTPTGRWVRQRAGLPSDATLRGQDVTVCLIEHHMAVVMEISDRIIVLDHGVRIAEGTPDAVNAA